MHTCIHWCDLYTHTYLPTYIYGWVHTGRAQGSLLPPSRLSSAALNCTLAILFYMFLILCVCMCVSRSESWRSKEICGPAQKKRLFQTLAPKKCQATLEKWSKFYPLIGFSENYSFSPPWVASSYCFYCIYRCGQGSNICSRTAETVNMPWYSPKSRGPGQCIVSCLVTSIRC